jgi:hypothetical protein
MWYVHGHLRYLSLFSVAGRDVAPTASTPHPEVTATPETLALWAKIRGELEARNYSRPASGAGVVGQLGAGTFGVDVSSWIGETTWSCIKGTEQCGCQRALLF